MIGDPKTILPTGAPNLALKLSDRQNDYFCGAIVSRACFPTLVSAPFSGFSAAVVVSHSGISCVIATLATSAQTASLIGQIGQEIPFLSICVMIRNMSSLFLSSSILTRSLCSLQAQHLRLSDRSKKIIV
jgi:hypothetical protein